MDELESDDEMNERPGFAMPGAWLLLTTALCLLCCAGVGMGIYQSETQGINATMMASFPFGFFVSGLLAALVTHFAVRNPAARALLPVGCGCLGGLGLFGVVLVFFMVIFPSL